MERAGVGEPRLAGHRGAPSNLDGGGLITLERARVVMYRPGAPSGIGSAL
jgi:hypothetical protein